MAVGGAKPILSVMKGGIDFSGNFNDRLLELDFTDNAGKESDEISFKLDDRDFAITLPSRGDTLNIGFGYEETGIVDKGAFEVSDVSGRGPPYEITVHAKTASQRSDQKSQRIYNHKGKKLEDVVKTIAQRHGLTPRMGSGFEDLQWSMLNQAEESDWHLLQRIARMYDGTFAVKGGALIFVQAASGMNASGLLMPSIVVTETDLISYEFKSGDRPKHKTVEASWYDRGTGRRKRETVDLSDDSSDGAVATHRIRHLHHNQAHAKHAAKGKSAALQRAEGSITIELTGDATIAAEGTVIVQTGRTGLDGEWTIKSVNDNFSEPGFITKITAEAKGSLGANGDADAN